jgi:hypothetical protein
MKKLISILALIIIPVSGALAQTWPGTPPGAHATGEIGSVLFPDLANSRLGIGTGAPTTRVEIFGNSGKVVLSNNSTDGDGGDCPIGEEKVTLGSVAGLGLNYNFGGETITKVGGGFICTASDAIAWPTGSAKWWHDPSTVTTINESGNLGIGDLSADDRISVNGSITVGAATNTNPGTIQFTGTDFLGHTNANWESLTVQETISSLNCTPNQITTWNGTAWVCSNQATNHWSTNGAKIYYDSGNVGIGTNDPAHTLDINGNIILDGSLKTNRFTPDDTNTLLGVGAAGEASLSSATDITAMGYRSYYSMNTATNGTAIGSSALPLDDNSGNTAIGDKAMTWSGQDSSYSNTAIGQFSLANGGGNSNTAIGQAVFYSLEDTTGNAGEMNTAVGVYAGLRLGDHNNIYGFSDIGAGRVEVDTLEKLRDSVTVSIDLYDSTDYEGTYVIDNPVYEDGRFIINSAYFGNGGVATGNIISFVDAGGGSVVVTSNGHGLANGDRISITGTANYDNRSIEINNVTPNTFQILAYDPLLGSYAGDDATGTWKKIIGIWSASNETPIGNVFIGDSSGENSLNGELNVFLGNYSGRYELGSQLLYIQNSSSSTPLLFADFGINTLAIDGGAMGVSTNNTALTLDVNGNIGATQFCNENGDNCYTTAEIASAASPEWNRIGNIISPVNPSTTNVSIDNDSFFHNASTGITAIDNLHAGRMAFGTNSGDSIWMNMNVTTASADNTRQEYVAELDGQRVLSVYGETASTGDVIKKGMAIGDGQTQLSSSNLPENSLLVGEGIICVDNGGDDCDKANRTIGNIYSESAGVSGLDLAEEYPTKDTTLHAGDVVMIDPEDVAHVKKYDPDAANAVPLGIVSTEPGLILGGFGETELMYETTVPVALLGRVPLKITTEAGDIKIGDFVTISNTVAGAAMKLTSDEQVMLGIALEPHSGNTTGSIRVFSALRD